MSPALVYDIGVDLYRVPDTQPEAPCTTLDPPSKEYWTEPQVLDANAGEDQQVTKTNQVIQLDGIGSKGHKLKYIRILKEGSPSMRW